MHAPSTAPLPFDWCLYPKEPLCPAPCSRFTEAHGKRSTRWVWAHGAPGAARGGFRHWTCSGGDHYPVWGAGIFYGDLIARAVRSARSSLLPPAMSSCCCKKEREEKRPTLVLPVLSLLSCPRPPCSGQTKAT
ncbi:hypothetical protein CRG98_001175 [Punica granatum]|uniref:Uncharacterized protein n=1 Tax=Punica granatum TaxID=22663 RepID=A0A2I0LCM8_PUNGR|nr:hypothetical protein CRG98_001175 [Punica granatum]